jgi:hypothetical protein
MTDSQMKMEVPEQVREQGVKSIDQAEAALARLWSRQVGR